MRGGFTIPEVLVAGSILLCVLGLASGLVGHSSRAAAQVGASEEAVRALSIGLEAIRRDVRRLVVLDPKQEFAILPDGRGLGVRLPKLRADDFWSMQLDVVEYRLVGTKLLRRDAMGTRAIGGCQLADIEFRYVDAEPGDRNAGYLSVTLLGPPPPKGATRLTASALLPLNRVVTPLPFKV